MLTARKIKDPPQLRSAHRHQHPAGAADICRFLGDQCTVTKLVRRRRPGFLILPSSDTRYRRFQPVEKQNALSVLGGNPALPTSICHRSQETADRTDPPDRVTAPVCHAMESPTRRQCGESLRTFLSHVFPTRTRAALPDNKELSGRGIPRMLSEVSFSKGSHARMSANADSRPVNASNPHSRPSNASTWQLCHYRCHVGNRQLATTRRAASLF